MVVQNCGPKSAPVGNMPLELFKGYLYSISSFWKNNKSRLIDYNIYIYILFSEIVLIFFIKCLVYVKKELE